MSKSNRIEITALPNFPLVEPGDDLALMIQASLLEGDLQLKSGDCLVLAQKVVSKSEGRYAYLDQVVPGREALELATAANKDPRLVQLVLNEPRVVLKHRPGAIIVEHRLGYVHANAGIDQSNIVSDPDHARVLLLPENPDKSAQAIRLSLQEMTEVDHLNIVISDSAGRAWRNGIMGFAIGTAGVRAGGGRIRQEGFVRA